MNKFTMMVVLAHLQLAKDTIVERLAKGRAFATERLLKAKVISQNGKGKCGGPKSTLQAMTPKARAETVKRLKEMRKQNMSSYSTATGIAALTKKTVDHKTVKAMYKEIAAKKW